MYPGLWGGGGGSARHWWNTPRKTKRRNAPKKRSRNNVCIQVWGGGRPTSCAQKTEFFKPPRFHVCSVHSRLFGGSCVIRARTPASLGTTFTSCHLLRGLPFGPWTIYAEFRSLRIPGARKTKVFWREGKSPNLDSGGGTLDAKSPKFPTTRGECVFGAIITERIPARQVKFTP